jgi:hypothetical protein
MRVDQTIGVINGNIPLEAANSSTFSLCSNGLIALKSFMNNPFFGGGLGSHSLSFDKYFPVIVKDLGISPRLNRDDANSLFFRLISETGLLGIFLFFYFLFRFYISKRRDENYWVISNAIVCLFILNILRQGNYFYNGFMFFVWTYYFTSKNAAELSAAKPLHEIKNMQPGEK